jgi:hypothetical protein
MKIDIIRQDRYSRGELLLRTFFGAIYIAIPHFFVLFFLLIGSAILSFITFWAILFTGRFPRGMWDYQVNLLRWMLRLSARLNNLSDGYPAFGLSAADPAVVLEAEYPERSSRGLLLLRVFLGMIYVYIPHGICLLFLSLAAAIVRFIAFWVVLFTGNYPAGMHEFMVGVMRWSMRVSAYMSYITDTYPPFSLAPDQQGQNVPLDRNI